MPRVLPEMCIHRHPGFFRSVEQWAADFQENIPSGLKNKNLTARHLILTTHHLLPNNGLREQPGGQPKRGGSPTSRKIYLVG
jgi:hypothetical protein